MSEHASANRTTNSQTTVPAGPSMTETEAPRTLDARQMSPARIMQMQRTLGNRAVQGMVQRMGNSNPVIQRNGSTTTAPGVSRAQQTRNTELGTARDAKVTTLVDAAYDDIADKLKKNIDTYLTSDSQAATIRKDVKDKVIAEISASIATTGTEAQRKDAMKFATAKADGIMIAKLKEYAITVSEAQFPAEAKKNAMKAEANKGYNITPNLNNATYEKQKTKAATDAKKLLDTYAKSLFATAVTESKNVITTLFTPATPGSTYGFSRIDVGTAGTAELTKRIRMDDLLVDQTTLRQEKTGNTTRDIKDMENIYLTVLIDPMKAAVVDKLGVGRREFRRSKELNEYRNELKKAAREKVNAQIESHIDNPTSSASTGPTASGTAPVSTGSSGATTPASTQAPMGAMKKEYMKTATKAIAYKDAKVLVDDVMRAEADTIVKTLVPKDTTLPALTEAGKSAAYEVAATNPSAAVKIQTASIKGAKAVAEKLLKENQPKAILEARKLTKGTKATATAAATKRVDSETTRVKTAVTDEEKTKKLAKTVITKSFEASDLSSGLEKVGKLIDVSTPNPGDATSMDFELKIPVASAAGGGTAYFLFGFGGEAEREQDELTVNSNLTFGVGFTTFGFDANFRAGLYLEGKGKDTDTVMNLLSYGLYRQMPTNAQEYFWGQGGRSGESSLVEAEKWAMMIEEQYMDDANSEVNVGLLTKLAMEANVGVASFSAELALKRLSKYNKEIIETKGKDASGNKRTALERLAANAQGKRTNGIGKGEVNTTVEAGTEIEIEFGKDKVAFGLEGSATYLNGADFKLKELSLSLSASIPSQFGEESGDITKYAAKIVTAAIGGGKNLTALFKKAIVPEADRGKRAVGTALDAGSDALFTGNYFDDIGASFAEKIQGDESVNDTMRSWLPNQDDSASEIETVNKIGLSNSLKLEVEFKKEYDGFGAPGDWEIGLSASQVKALEVDAEIVKVAIEKSKRLGKLEFAKGKTTKYEGLGFEGGGKDRPVPAPTTATPTATTTPTTGSSATSSTPTTASSTTASTATANTASAGPTGTAQTGQVLPVTP